MKRKFSILILMVASLVIILPAESAAYASSDRSASVSSENLILQQGRGRGRGGRYDRYWESRGRRRNGTWYGYRNYGQYRRTQVGNRRYRNVRTSIWRDGRRVSIWRRIFY
jgi:hypothetical protein